MEENLVYFYRRLDQHYAEGDLDAVERFLLEYAQAMRQSGADALIAVCNELGSFYRGVSRYAQSLSAFQEAGEKIVARLGTDCTEYATLLNNMAGTFRLAGRQERALDCFSRAVEIYRRCGAEESYAYASVLNNMALAHQELGQNEAAAQCLEQALALIEKLPEHRQEAAVTYSNLTALYHKLGRRRKAMGCLDRALAIFEACGREKSPHYAAALNSLAGFLYDSGEDQRAIKTYQKAAAYTRRFFGENVDYAVTCQNMCWVYKRMGRLREAAEALRTAERVYCRLFGPEHERTQMTREELRRLPGESGL